MIRALLTIMTNFAKLLFPSFIIIIICFINKAVARNQKTKMITISMEMAKLKTVLKEIELQSGVIFTFSNDDIDQNRLISIKVSNCPLSDLLDEVLVKNNYNWKMIGRIVVVKKYGYGNNEQRQEKPSIDSFILVSGTVVDIKGNPIPGATVVLKSTKRGVITNVNGEFYIDKIPQQSHIVVSSIGFISQELSVGNRWKWNSVVMFENVNKLDETVVTAYSTTSQRYATGAITTINAKSIENKAISNPLLALQAEVPGIVINQNSGIANAGITVQIRGVNSLRNGTDPLYVVDGVPYPSQLLPTINTSMGISGNGLLNAYGQAGNPLSFLNPSDIESISVLRDADATSVYGSRAAAGAIIITTKKGKIGPAKFNFNYQNGIGNVARKLDVLKTRDYLKMRHEALANDNLQISATDYDLNGMWDTTRTTDWQKVLLGGTAKYSEIQGSASGGSENLQYLIGLGYHKETTIYPTDLGDQKGSVHLNISNFSANKRFQCQLMASYMLDDNRILVSNLATTAFNLPPVAPSLFKEDGSLNWAPDANGVSTWLNPLAFTQSQGKIKTSNLISNLVLQYEFFPGLSLKSNFGFTNMQIDEYQITPLSFYAPEVRPYTLRSANYANGNTNSWIVEPQLNYKGSTKNSKFDFLVGTTIQRKSDNQERISGYGYPSDLLLLDPRSAATIYSPGTVNTLYKYNALFITASYRLKDRYLLNIGARRDGSSRFGSNNLFHNFGSIAGGWIFTSENWLNEKIPFLTFGKLRASYGTSGNDQIGDYGFINNYSSNTYPVLYQGIVGLTPVGIPNPYLQWEETKKMQLGIDLGFINDNILLNVNYYRNRSSNQLLAYKLPNIAGALSYPRNLPAIIDNFGWEFSLSSINVKKRQFSWSSNLNFTIARNKLVSFPGLANSSYSSLYKVGEPMSGVKVYKFHGVNPETGLYDFYNSKGGLTSSPVSADRQSMINVTPTFYCGLGNEISYKNFQLSILIQATEQVVLNSVPGFNPGPGFFSGPSRVGNQPVYVLDRWSKPGDVAGIQKFTSRGSASYRAAVSSTLAYTDAFSVRVKNISASWNIPSQILERIHFKSCKLSVYCTNLFTFTNFKGLDPESGNLTIPPLRIIMAGISIGL